jgi:hypothetical protein
MVYTNGRGVVVKTPRRYPDGAMSAERTAPPYHPGMASWVTPAALEKGVMRGS